MTHKQQQQQEEQYISAEQHHTVHSQRPQRQVNLPLSKIGLVAGVIVLCGISFWNGTAYQKDHMPVSTAVTAATPGGFSPRGGFIQRRGDIGEVTAVASDNITVKNQQDDSSTSYTITGNTVVTNDGSSASVSDIKVGDTVAVMTTSSDSKQAQRIIINPQMGSFGGPSAESGGSADSTQAN